MPIVSRELRVAARRAATFWLRSAGALAVILLATAVFLITLDSPAKDRGITLFAWLAAAELLACLFQGVRFTADCISEEKREGTFGLLFLTDLKGYDVVIGKLAATSLNAFYSLLASVPVLAVPVLLGGVTGGEVLRVALVLVNTLFFSLAAGVFVSSLSVSSRRALAGTFLLILLVAAGPPLAGVVGAARNASGQFPEHWLIPSPGYTLSQAFDFFYVSNPQSFWVSLGIAHALAWLFLAASSVIAPRSWQDRPAGVAALRWRDRWLFWSHGNTDTRSAFRRRLLAKNPFFWLSARSRLKPAAVWAALLILGCLWLWGAVKFRDDWFYPWLYALTGLVLNCVLKVWVALETGRQLAEDHKSGALELLLSTPLQVREIVHGQWLALVRQFFGPLLFVLGVGAVLLVAGCRHPEIGGYSRGWVFPWLLSMVLMPADLMALHYLGMWNALTARTPVRAVTTGVLRILVLPWALVGIIGVFVGILSIYVPPLVQGDWFWFWIWLWFGLSVVIDLAFGSWAYYKLMTQFRAAAAQRYSRPPRAWRRLLGKA